MHGGVTVGDTMRITAAHTRFGRAVTVHCFLNAENFFASYFELRMSVTHWLFFTATDDVVAVALIVTLLVLGNTICEYVLRRQVWTTVA